MELIRISVEVEPVPVRRSEARALLTKRMFITAWHEWSRFRRFGLPHGGQGYKRERGPVIWVIEALEQELEAFQADSMESRHG